MLSGSSNALELLLNVEQYEIMKGPQIDTGVKVNNIILNIEQYGMHSMQQYA